VEEVSCSDLPAARIRGLHRQVRFVIVVVLQVFAGMFLGGRGVGCAAL
jgi:hypothetical protein